MNYLSEKLANFDSQFRTSLKPLFLIALIFFILAVYNAIVLYLVPGILLETGMSETKMGILLSVSSVFGIIFDLLLNRFLRTTRYLMLILYSIVLMFLFPLTILFSSSILLIILGLAIWAFFTDLSNFATYDFVARESRSAFHVSGMAFLSIFNDLGYVAGTLAASPIEGSWDSMEILYLLLGILAFSSLLLLATMSAKKEEPANPHMPGNTIVNSDFRALLAVAKRLFPLLALITLSVTVEAVTWTVTPVIYRIAPILDGYGGVILALRFLPALTAYMISGHVSNRLGKKKTAAFSFIASSVILIFQGLADTAALYIALSTLAAFISGFFFPAIGGAFADYLKETKSFETEILTSDSISKNIAYIAGPVIGGILMQLTHSIILFTYLGIFVTAAGFIILFSIPGSIDFRDKSVMGEAG